MRSICKKGSATLVAVLALCALTAASASAAEWYVGGKPVAGNGGIAEAVKVEENIVLSVPSVKVAITCTALAARPPSGITGTNTLHIEFLKFNNCKTTEPTSGCELEASAGGSYKANYLEGAAIAEGKSPEDQLQLKSKEQNGEFMEFWFDENDTCSYKSLQELVMGKMTLTMPKGREELAEQTFVGQGTKETPNGLTFLGHPAYLTGKFKLKLASGAKWSFH